METAVHGMPRVAELARLLREVQERASDLNAQIKELASQKEALSQAIVDEMKLMGNDDQATGVILEGIGVLKLETKAYPRLLNVDAFVAWGKDTNQMLPPLTVNPNTLSSWFSEQQKINQPVPSEDILPVFWKTSAKVVKRG